MSRVRAYRHVQSGRTMLLVTSTVLAVILAIAALDGLPASRVLVAVAAIGLVLWLFHALAVEVDGDAVRLAFGPGLFRKRIPLASIRGVRVVRNPWWSGWGIRWMPGRWTMWNVAGFDAVELDLDRGARFRIGTDEPHALARAIERAIGTSEPGRASRKSRS
jgi:hypothetical protein